MFRREPKTTDSATTSADFPQSSTSSSPALTNLIDVPIVPDCRVCIAVPVRDEAENIRQTLDALASQVDLENNSLDKNSFEIILLVNNCADDSAAVARRWQSQNRAVNLHIAEITLPKKNSNIGFVRRLLFNEAFARLQSNAARSGVIMTTDGDTRAAPDWVAQNLAEIERGADAVGGRILIKESELARMDARARYFHLRDEEYRLLVAEFECLLDRFSHDAAPRHHQHFNASFAVTTDAFERAGGVPQVKHLEDVAFYQALLRIDARFRHSLSVKVFTSARHIGRTTLGLSTQINEWTKMGRNNDDYLVESAAAIEKRVLARKTLRGFWMRARAGDFPAIEEILPLAEILCVSVAGISVELKRQQSFGELMEKIVYFQKVHGGWKRQNRLVCIENALAELHKKLAELHGGQSLKAAQSKA